MKHLCEIKAGARFLYGGVEWVKLSMSCGGVLSLAAESVFDRAFDEENCNDFNKSSLRRELNGPFLDALIQEGADPAAFLEFNSDLTADDGMTDYGESTNKIALLSCNQYREYRGLFPQIGEWWWTLTPWTCDPEYSYYVRYVVSSGALYSHNAYGGNGGVRPLCNLSSDILVSIPGEEDNAPDTKAAHAEALEDAHAAILNTLEDYPSDVWGDALGAAVASVLNTKRDAEEIRLEEQARREQE